MPTLEWIGKDKVINHHQEVPFRILDKKYTFNAENSENMIIHGDNLLALKSLLPQYEGLIDCIYIDPPYNTGTSEGKWVYSDNVDDPRIKKWLGEVVGAEGEDLSRHDKWLCMMYPRVKLLYKLLSETGVIFISIDNNEFINLKYIFDEIFGKNNFITVFAVENNPKGRKNNAFVSEGYEYCLLYCKNRNVITQHEEKRVFRDVVSEKNTDTRAVLRDKWGAFKQSKRQVSGCNKSNALCIVSKEDRCFTIYYKEQTDDLQCLDEYDKDKDEWFLSITGEKLLSNGYTRYICTNSQTGRPSIPLYAKKTLFEKHDEHLLFFKNDGTIYEKERDGQQQITSFLPNKRFGDMMTETATVMLENIFGYKGAFNNAKNVEFIQLLLSLIKKDDAIFLDSFGGSGTTAHAVLNLNKKDGGKRKFILVEMMDYADTITAERVKRVINGYGKDDKAVAGIPGDFTYYELGQPLFKDDKNLNEEVGEEEIRKYVYYVETKKPIESNDTDNRYYMGKNNDTAYYFYYKKDEITTLNHEFLSMINTKATGYIIYADKCVLAQEVMEKFNIVFKKIPRDITRL